MPELPEVETTLRGLTPHLINKTVQDVTIRNPNLRIPFTMEMAQQLQDKRILSLERRAKYIIVNLAHGYLLIHLGMSGHLRVVPTNLPPKKHDHIDVRLDSGMSLRFNDPRRFGLLIYSNQNLEEHPLLKHLGPEPLSDDFTPEYLFKKSRSRHIPSKSFIMNNDIVVGVGNIYATESLFLAKIHPLKPANQLSLNDCDNLVCHIKTILAKAIESGGTTLRDFYGADGKPGYFNLSLYAYGRKGLTCLICHDCIGAVVIAGRNSAYCPSCQSLS